PGGDADRDLHRDQVPIEGARVEGLADLRLLPRRPTGEHIVAAGRCGGGGGPEEAGEDDEREPQVPHALRIGVWRPASHSRERVGGIPDLRCFAWTSLRTGLSAKEVALSRQNQFRSRPVAVRLKPADDGG